MKPSNDPFEQHIQGLYEGLEVPAPASTKAAVFNALDKNIAAGSMTSKVSKSILAAATVILAVTWYMMPGETTVEPQAPAAVTPVLVEEAIEEAVEEVVEETPVVEVAAEPVAEPVAVEVIVEPVVSEPAPVVEEVKAEPVAQPEAELPTDPVVEEVVVEAPVEVQADQPADEKADAPEVKEDDKKDTEWVLPATLKVEE
jgi:type IV secretory pathway VirB10-like protein